MNTEVTKTFSWEILSYNIARKICDKSVYYHHGSGIPQSILWFFNANQMIPGEQKNVSLYYQGVEYFGRIARANNKVGRARIFWNSSLAEKLSKAEDKDEQYALEFYRIGNEQYELSLYPVPQNTWLIPWNQAEYEWTNYEEECSYVKSGGIINTEWTCYNMNPKSGDDVFLLKLGGELRGIVGHGIVTKDSLTSVYLPVQKDKVKENTIELDMDCLLDYENGEILPQTDLINVCEAQTWSLQQSGTIINDEVMPSLWGMWNSVLSKIVILDKGNSPVRSTNNTNSFLIPFSIGDTVTNAQIVSTFKVGNMGGMRRSKQTNTLVIICDHTKGLYDDKWHGDVLHYTGMGKIGDQTLSGNQNGTLYNSSTNHVAVHLFEALEPKKYIYQGEVELDETPYQANQYDINGNDRMVWIFPIRSKTQFAIVEREVVENNLKSKTEEIAQMAYDELKRKAIERQTTTVPNRKTVSTTYIRDPFIAKYACLRANGKCQLCGQTAPFLDVYGEPYLESHHIIWLSRGGADTIDNTIGLCPNCHRKMHVLDMETDRKKLIIINSQSQKNRTDNN